MSPLKFLGVLLLTLLTVPTLSEEIQSEGKCCYRDRCSNERICAEDGLLKDSCGDAFDVAMNCTLSKRGNNDDGMNDAGGAKPCCYRDRCSNERVCAENGLLKDSCGDAFDVAMNCTLSKRENDEDEKNGTSAPVIGPQDADPESSSTSSEPSPSFEMENPMSTEATITPLLEVPLTTPLTQPSPAENDQDRVNGTKGATSCCYTDACSGEDICAEDGILRDACGAAFDVAMNCGLTKRQNDEDGRSPKPSQSSEFGDPLTTTPPSTSPSAQPSSSPIPSFAEPTNEEDGATSVTSEAVCIHSQHLSHLPSSALLHPRHVLAHVLCDSSESCATPGHMVVYKGGSMRMSGYCQIVGCHRKQGLVNSPRYYRGGRVESNSKHLVFTMLAARFETRFEEVLLAGLVRAGL